MMPSLVHELQRDSYESKVSVSELLRKSLVVARKLNLSEFEDWIKAELNGYSDAKFNDDVPIYREIQGQIKAHNPFRGWQPVIIQEPSVYDKLSKRRISQPLPQLEELVKASGGKSLQVPFSPEIESVIMKMIEFELPEWALKLEGDGIMGEGMSFTKEEKQKAEEKNYTVNNFYGNIIQSPIQQNAISSTQTTSYETLDITKLNQLLEEIKSNIDKIPELTVPQKEKIDTNLMTIATQLNTNKPAKKVIFECLSTIRNVLEGAAGSIIAAGLLYKLHLFIN